MRIAFFGTQEFGLPALASLAAAHPVVAVVTQPARPAGRGRKLEPTPVEQAARAAGLPVLTPENPNAPDFLAALSALAPELAVLVAYGSILGSDLLRLPPSGFLNLHPSLLPKYRGAAPIQRCLMAGDAGTGVSIIRMTRKVDAGPILLQRPADVGPAENAAELGDRLARIGAELTVEAVSQVAAGRAAPRPQDESEATAAPKITDAERRLDWRRPVLALHNTVRALAPRPAACAAFRDERVLVLRAQPRPGPARAPGTVALDLPGLAVAGADGLLELLELRPQAGKTQTGASFRNGRRLTEQDRFN